MADLVRSSPPVGTKTSRSSILPRIEVASALAAATLAGTTGVALAGGLPGAAQNVASSMLAKVGLSVPAGDGHADTHATVRSGLSDQAQGPASTGADISDLATTTDLTGVAKGAAVSTLASGGKSHAG